MFLRLTSLMVFILLISSCQPKKVKEIPARPKLDIRLSEAEVDSLKSFILQEYWKYDSVYFSPAENCYFRYFIENELESLGYYYETMFKGISIKHYSSPYNDFAFNIVRGSGGKFYYVGLSDLNYITEGILKEKYYERNRNDEYRLSLQEMRFIPLKASTEKTFNRILEEDALFTFLRLKDSYRVLSNAQAFIFQNYKTSQDSRSHAIIPALKKPIGRDNLKEVLEGFKGGELSENETGVVAQYQNLTMTMDEEMDIYNFYDTGLLIFNFKKGKGKVTLNQSFLPATNRYGFGIWCSLIDWSLYPECRGLPNTIVEESTDED